MSELKDHLRNGATMLDNAGVAPAVDTQLVATLRQILARAEAGEISSFACLTVSRLGAMQWPAYGSQVAELYTAAGLFQRVLENAMTGAGQRKGSLLRG